MFKIEEKNTGTYKQKSFSFFCNIFFIITENFIKIKKSLYKKNNNLNNQIVNFFVKKSMLNNIVY